MEICVSEARAFQNVECGWFIEEALLQQQRGNEVLEPHCERVMGQSSRHFDSGEMFGIWH